MKTISTSGQKAFRRCHRYYKFAYIDEYEPALPDTGARGFGTLFHEAIAERLKSHHRKQPVADDLVSAKIFELMTGYYCRWEKDGVKALEIEKPFTAPIINPETGATSRTWTLTGILDGIVEVNGKAMILEHKTSSEDIRPGSPYWQKLRIDTQISNYYVGAKSLGYEIDGVLYDVIKKPTIRPYDATPIENRKYKKDGNLYSSQRENDETIAEYRARLRDDIASNPESYYQRGEVHRLQAEEKDAAYDLWQTCKEIRDSELSNRWPRNTDSCFKFSRPCDFWPVCTGECSLDDPIRFTKKETKIIGEIENGTRKTEVAF